MKSEAPDPAAFAPPEAPLPMPVQRLETPRRPFAGLRRLLTPWLHRAAD